MAIFKIGDKMIQANVINGDSVEFDALVYPQQHPNTLGYIQNALSNIPATLMSAGKHLFESAYQKYLNLTSSEMMMRARNAIMSATNFKQENVIYPLLNVLDCQTSTITMQRWIMAESTTRQLYHEQKCDGFSDTYVDREPNKVGEDHYDFRRVMDGVVRYDEDDLICRTYAETMLEGDRELDPFEKISILNSWEVLRIAISQMNDDPTDPFGGKL